MRIVVTGGAGYIGSHVVHALVAAGHEPIVLDDLSNGHADAVGTARLVRGDVCAPNILAHLVEETRAEAILHFAARIQVGESVSRPDLYYNTNVGGMLQLVTVAAAHHLPVVFSSTAAVYGEPEIIPIPVTHPCRPESPYGASKWMCERILLDATRANQLRHVTLRYFNAAGANVEAGLGEHHHPETHLIPLAIDAARKRTPALTLFGTDWPTPDGTCIRDYIHVVDLADAHVRALEYLAQKGASTTLNLGGGTGTTVRQILNSVAKATGQSVPHELAPRRPGDVASLVADITEARRVLNWTPKSSNIDQIVADAAALRP